MVTPYYEDGQIQVFCGDAVGILPSLVGIGALISDPPYGMAAAFTRKGIRRKTSLNGSSVASREWSPIANDENPFDPSHLLGFAIIALSGANHYADKLPACSKWLIWDKRCGSAQDNNSDCEMIWTNQAGATRIHYQKWRGIVRAGEENLSRQAKVHPAQKPVSLMRWIIGQLKVPKDVIICDPYMGSGSTLAAAQQLGYRAIGIEIDEEYCKVAVSRLKQPSLLAAV